MGLQLNSVVAGDEIKIHLIQPSPNKLGVGDLWNLELENTTKENLTIYLEGFVTQGKDGLIVEGQSKPFVIKPGKTSYGYNDFKSGTVNWKNKKYQEAIVRTGGAPTGNYTICVTAKYENGNIAGQENCIEQQIEITSEQQVMLISPNDGEELDPDTLPGLTFMWNSGANGPYELIIVEIKGELSYDEAMKNNRPFFEQKGIMGNTFQYPVTAPKFVEGKKYVWMVKSGEVQSELKTFGMIAQIHQLRTLSIQTGAWDEGKTKCDCMQHLDCICHIVRFNNYNSVSEIHLPKGQISVVISSAVISGNTLEIKFKDRLNMELKSNDFRQEQEVSIGSDLCKELGYDSITIIPGNYTIKDGTNITLNVRLNPTHQLRTLILQQGNTQVERPPSSCQCGATLYDCVCGIGMYVEYAYASAINLPLGQIHVVISSTVISGNTLHIKFTDRLNMELKSNNIKQKEEVKLGSDLCKELGYDSITILPGDYTIKELNSITVNVKLGKKNDVNKIKLISPNSDK